MKKAVLSISGGMDSTSLLIHLLSEGYEVRCYSFDYGQRHDIEMSRLRDNVRLLNLNGFSVDWKIIDLKSVFDESSSSLITSSGKEIPEGHYADENMKSTVVENRNVIFASIIYGKALSWANSTNDNVEISLGIHSGDHNIYPDCRPESRDALEKAFKISNWNSERVSYYTPYVDTDKTGILRDLFTRAISLKLNPLDILRNTNTCYSPNEKGESCGKCGSCIERLEAFNSINQTDPIPYV